MDIIKLIIDNLFKIVIILIPVIAPIIIQKLLKDHNDYSKARQMVIIADDIVNSFKKTYPDKKWLDMSDQIINAIVAQFPDLPNDVMKRVADSAIVRGQNGAIQ